MNLHQTEQVVLAVALKYGREALKHVLPGLTADKFICNEDGQFGKEHSFIWSQIVDQFGQHKEPYIGEMDNQPYLKRLVSILAEKHFIYDSETYLEYATLIDRAGTLYQLAEAAGDLYSLITCQEYFEKQLNRTSLENMVSEHLNRIRSVYSNKGGGYKHVSEVVGSMIEKWDRMYAGEQLEILPCGWPTLEAAQLFPISKLALIHGMSSIGKTAFVLGILTGTALGLKANGVQGCVAMNSLEMDGVGLTSRIASMLAGIDFTRLRGGKVPLTAEEFKRLKEWAEFVGTLPIYIDDTNLMTTDVMQYQAADLSITKGPIYQLASDYTELFSDEGDTKEQIVSNVVRNQFHIARQLECSVLAISQSTYENDYNKYMIAGINGLRYSRGATQAADIIAELWNPVAMQELNMNFKIPEGLDGNSAWLLVQKYRDGQRLNLRLGWESTFTRFFDRDYVISKGGQMITYSHLERLQEAKGLTVGEVWS